MNNNHSKNKSDDNHDNSQWAKFVDQRNQSTLKGGSDRNELVNKATIETDDLNPDLLDDLELDGQLRVLGKISIPNDSFVDTVVAQTHPESKLIPANRSRLPVLKPSSVSRSTETTTETISASQESDWSDSAPATLSKEVKEVRYRRSVAFFASLAAALLIGCFLGSIWWFGSDPNIAGTPAPKTAITKSNELEANPDPSNDSENDSPEIFPENDFDSPHFSEDEALVEQSKGESSGGGSIAAMEKETDQEDLDRILEETNDTHSNPTLADVNKEFDSAVESTEDGLPPFADVRSLEDQKAEIANADGPIWDSELDWNLDLQFHDNGIGSAALNGKLVQAIFLQDNATFLLRQIASELQRRVRFMENRLGSKVNGSISVEGTDFYFHDISQLDQTVKEVDRHIAELRIRGLTLDELMMVRRGYREGIIANRNKFDSIDLADKNLSFYTEDEAFTICSVLSSSEALLQDLAKKRLVWEEDKEIDPTESKLATTIAPRNFLLFTQSGLLQLPDSNFSDPSIASIQDLSPSELRQWLHAVPSVELFRDGNEFQKAKDFVYSNGPLEMQLRLSIDEIDRKLEDKKWKAFMEGPADEQKFQLRRELRRAVRKDKSLGDDIALEPLKDVLAQRTDLHGLPLSMGDECQSDVDETRDLKQVSSSVGRTIGAFNGSLGSRDAAQNDAFRNLSIKQMVSFCMRDHAENPTSQKLKTIDQILQIDHPRLRLEMIDSLRKSGTVAAIKVMVNKAKFDLESKVRIAAIEGLADVEPDIIRQSLLDGLNYPWHVVAEHSAEALVQLNDQDAIPSLIDMLDLPHPQFPTQDNGELVQRELVGINHMRNCLLCHAPSISQKDSVRGLIPHTSRPLPPLYYGSGGSSNEVPFAVRADITYLEQDFSVVLPVENPGPWPSEQRFDFVVQQKRLTADEAEKAAREINQSPNRNRNAIIFALRELTGETPANNSSDNWRNIMAARQDNGK